MNALSQTRHFFFPIQSHLWSDPFSFTRHRFLLYSKRKKTLSLSFSPSFIPWLAIFVCPTSKHAVEYTSPFLASGWRFPYDILRFGSPPFSSPCQRIDRRVTMVRKGKTKRKPLSRDTQCLTADQVIFIFCSRTMMVRVSQSIFYSRLFWPPINLWSIYLGRSALHRSIDLWAAAG